MNKQQLASKIWAGADALRGKVSADAYKDYMLGFIFYKYISNKEEKVLKEKLFFSAEEMKNLNEDDKGTVDFCKKNLGFFIEYKNLFSTWISKGKDFQIKDVRTALSAFNRNISEEYKKVYEKIFDTLEKGLDVLGINDIDRTKATRDLLELIQEIPIDGNNEYDVLGFVYEYLLKNFAANADKAGEFYTPHEASLLMSEIVAEHLKNKKEISIYDPTSGSGSLLINIGKTIAKHMTEKNKIKYYAQELILNTYNLTRMNLLMRDILPANIDIRNGDTLKEDWPVMKNKDNEKTFDPLRVDAVISNPPYSQTWDTDNAEFDSRFKEYGIAPKTKADYAFLLHELYHLKTDGIMTIVLPHGVLFRGGNEKDIRQNLINKGNIDTIIGLPSNMFFGTPIPTIIMILKKQRDNDNILFIDASKDFVKDGKKNKLRAMDIKKILDAVLERKTIDKYSKLVTKSEIVENDYNLNIPRYVDSGDTEDCVDIYAGMYGGIPIEEINNLNKYWDTFPSLRNEIFSDKNTFYAEIVNGDVNEIINKNKDVQSFIENYKNTFNSMSSYLNERLIVKVKESSKKENSNINVENEIRANAKKIDINIYAEKEIIAEKLRYYFNNIKLVSFYDAYQIFEDNWDKIVLDFEILNKEGISALNKVDANLVYKKNKKKELEEVQEGYIGRILPYELVQNEYFKTEKQKMDNLTSDLQENELLKNELLDSFEENDKVKLLKEDTEDIDSKKLGDFIKRISKDVKNGAVYDENSFEDIILQINKVNENIKKIKKEISEINIKLEIDTKNKIESLTEDETLNLLKQKWINPIYEEILKLPDIVIKNLYKDIEKLKNKYSKSFIDLNNEIVAAEKELANMLDELDGNDFDIEGLQKLKSFLEGGLA